MSRGVGCRHGSDPTLLWLWRRPVAIAPSGPLAWEHPYAVGAALENAKSQKIKIKKHVEGGPVMAQRLTNMTSIHEDVSSIPNLTQWVKDLVLP